MAESVLDLREARAAHLSDQARFEFGDRLAPLDEFRQDVLQPLTMLSYHVSEVDLLARMHGCLL